MIGTHVGTHLVVIANADVHVFLWHKLSTQHEMSHQVAAKLVFLHQVAIAVVLVFGLIVGQVPLAQVPCCDSDAEWSARQH